MKQKLIAIALLTLMSCQDDDNATPQGTAYEMAGTWNVVVQDFYNNNTRYCTVQLNPISANRSLMVYGGCNGTSSSFNYPNDTIDFASNGTLTIGRDTFNFPTSTIIHYATGNYTENSILFPNYKYFEIQGNNQNVYTYGYQLTR